MSTQQFVNYVKAQLAERGKTITDLTSETGMSRQNFFHWEKKGRAPSKESLEIVSKYLDVPVAELDCILYGNTSVKSNSDFDRIPEGYSAIPEYRLSLKAGNTGGDGPEWEELHDVKPIILPDEFFQAHHTTPRRCKRARVCGDSMEPELHSGDRVTFIEEPCPEIGCVHIIDGEIYVISVENTMKIKRLSTIKGGIAVISDNSDRYPPEIYRGEECNQIRVYGRVIHMDRGFGRF